MIVGVQASAEGTLRIRPDVIEQLGNVACLHGGLADGIKVLRQVAERLAPVRADEVGQDFEPTRAFVFRKDGETVRWQVEWPESPRPLVAVDDKHRLARLALPGREFGIGERPKVLPGGLARVQPLAALVKAAVFRTPKDPRDSIRSKDACL